MCGCVSDLTASCAGKNCGQVVDNCGSLVTCGTCTGGNVCGAGGANVCGQPSPVKSCSGIAETCGPTSNADCCASVSVTGGLFNRIPNAASDTTGLSKAPAHVTSFHLDAFEVTVARFRAFVQEKSQGNGTQVFPPAAGTGVNPHVDPSITSMPGYSWSTSWNTNLATNTSALVTALQTGTLGVDYTYQSTPGPEDNVPVNRVTWFEAFAFCAWDGGWLPAENEWLYAATGGTHYQVWPWSTVSASPWPGTQPGTNCVDANLSPGCGQPIAAVGTKSAPLSWNGSSLYDLVGNVDEWVFDGSFYYEQGSNTGNTGSWSNDLTTGPSFGYKDCSTADCEYASTNNNQYYEANFTLGGNYGSTLQANTWTYRAQTTSTVRAATHGFRCARP